MPTTTFAPHIGYPSALSAHRAPATWRASCSLNDNMDRTDHPSCRLILPTLWYHHSWNLGPPGRTVKSPYNRPQRYLYKMSAFAALPIIRLPFLVTSQPYSITTVFPWSTERGQRNWLQTAKRFSCNCLYCYSNFTDSMTARWLRRREKTLISISTYAQGTTYCLACSREGMLTQQPHFTTIDNSY